MIESSQSAEVTLLILSFIFALSLFNTSAWEFPSHSYLNQYSHLKSKQKFKRAPLMKDRGNFLLILVNARHLDYSNNQAFFKTLVKHPSDASKNGDVGHAWIFLKGNHGIIEGGHTGEFGIIQPKYFDGIMDLADQGDSNPIRYLWETLSDGAFQRGAGGHTPTFAIKLDLTEDQYEAMHAWIETYDFQRYRLIDRQCVSFACQAALLAGLELDAKVTMKIDQEVILGKERLVFWADPKYSEFSFLSPDILEKSLMTAVLEGKAEYALHWYLFYYQKPIKQKLDDLFTNLQKLPERMRRVHYCHNY